MISISGFAFFYRRWVNWDVAKLNKFTCSIVKHVPSVAIVSVPISLMLSLLIIASLSYYIAFKPKIVIEEGSLY